MELWKKRGSKEYLISIVGEYIEYGRDNMIQNDQRSIHVCHCLKKKIKQQNPTLNR